MFAQTPNKTLGSVISYKKQSQQTLHQKREVRGREGGNETNRPSPFLSKSEKASWKATIWSLVGPSMGAAGQPLNVRRSEIEAGKERQGEQANVSREKEQIYIWSWRREAGRKCPALPLPLVGKKRGVDKEDLGVPGDRDSHTRSGRWAARFVEKLGGSTGFPSHFLRLPCHSRSVLRTETPTVPAGVPRKSLLD